MHISYRPFMERIYKDKGQILTQRHQMNINNAKNLSVIPI